VRRNAEGVAAPTARPAAVLAPAGRWLPLAGVIAAVSVYAVAQGLSYPLLSFILESQGHSPALIGLSAAMTPLGFICCALLVPVFVRRIGAGATIVVSAFAAAAILALIAWTRDLTPWFVLRFLLGAAVLPLYIISEVWIMTLAPPERRGRVMGVYTSVISAGFAAGPAILVAVGSQGWAPFAVGIVAFLICGLCLLALLPRMPVVEDGNRDASIRGFLPKAPVLLFAVFVTGVIEQACFSLLPVYGLSHGMGEAEVSALLAVLIAGNALQVPIGLAAERWSARAVLTACAAATAAGSFLIPVLVGTWLIWPLMFLWGATSFGAYTAAIITLGARFSGSMLVAGNSAFALIWGFGGIAGPSATGGVMNLAGPEGMPLLMGTLAAALALLTARRERAAGPAPELLR